MTVGAGHSAARHERKLPRAGRKWRLALLGIVTTFALLACYDLISLSGRYGSDGVAAAARTVGPAGPAGGSPPAERVVPQSAAAPRAAPARPGAAVVRPLDVTSVAAFGPAGLADGDNPGIASRVLGAGAGQPWYSLWYATPGFGNLQSGTGVLLDMGQSVTVSSVRLVLGRATGADVQLRVGDGELPADLPSVASAADVGGAVRLTATTTARGRYVLIWFTRLPPNSQGEYQVEVYGVTVAGTVSHR